jgi:hypothetical protein
MRGLKPVDILKSNKIKRHLSDCLVVEIEDRHHWNPYNNRRGKKKPLQGGEHI